MTGYGGDVAGLAMPLTDPADLDALLDRAADARVVLIGEATHGTRDFYRWRDLLTRRLVAEQGVACIAVEGDWADCARLDACVRLRAGAPADPVAVLSGFSRWPTWMWANEEVAEFAGWLRRHNAARDPDRRVGFHGLDLYGLWDSLGEVLRYLQRHAPGQVAAALAAYACFAPFGEDPRRYARATTRTVPESCEDEVVALLTEVRTRVAAGADADFDAWQNAEVVAGAERFYRALAAGGRQSWNVRDRHMDDTLARLCAHYGPHARAVVWAHNTHVGDARATDMARAGEVNIGQLARERHGPDRVVLVGLGCHRGEVVAAPAWDAPMRRMGVPPARPGSLEDVLHRHAPGRAVLVFPGGRQPRLLTDQLGHRAIGVVYDPAHEHRGAYVPTVLGDRYDAFLWCDDTAAVRPLPTRPVPDLVPETYPTGV